MALTREELLALRHADDSVSFYWSEVGAESGDSRSFAIARKRVNPGDGFPERTITSVIPLSEPIFTIYDQDGSNRGRPRSCYTSANCPRVNPEWQTILHFLRAGDVLIPEWIGGNTNELTRAAGLTYDEFRLRVQRPAANGRFRILTFILNHMVTKADSSARMIQL